MTKFRRSGWFLLCIALMLVVMSIPAVSVPVSAAEVAAVHTKSNGNPYYIMVNRQMNTVTIYKVGSDGYYSVPYKAMICSCGRSGHATPAGTFKTPNSRYVWRLMVDGSYGHYASRIDGSILFHSVCFTSASSSTLMTDEYNMLGNNASLGCVRLQVADAKWIYDNVGTGTYVTVYDSPDPGALGKPAKAVDNISSSPYKNWDPTDPSSSNPWRFDINTDVYGPGSASGAGSYRYDAGVTLTAYPKDQARFDGWFDLGGNLISTNTAINVTVKRATSYIARFTQMITVNAHASRSGSAWGGGNYPAGTAVSVFANTGSAPFLGWYDIYGNKVTSQTTFTEECWGNRDLYAMYQGDVFGDIPAGAWYLDDVMNAYKDGVTNGISPILFGPQNSFTRAMAVQMLFRVNNLIPRGPDPVDKILTFSDVPDDAWYADAVKWAASRGIVNGVGDGKFDPNAVINRAQMVTILGRYLDYFGKLTGEFPEGLVCPDADQVPDYALDWFIKAGAIGLVKGYEDGTVRPANVLTRAEGAALMMRTKKQFIDY